MNKIFAPALYRDNLKRYWGLSVVAALFFYLGALYGITMDRMYGYEPSYYSISSMLSNRNGSFLLLHLAIPVAAALCMFAYLNKVSSTNIYNSWPLNRNSMYLTNWLSGFTVCLLPLITTFLVMLALKTKVYAPGTSENIYTAAACFSWLIQSVVIEIFIYSIAVVGCVISGNGVIALLTAVALNFVIPAVIVSSYGYVGMSCFGFSVNNNAFMDMAIKFSPWLRVMDTGHTTLSLVIYGIAAIAVAVLGAWIYSIRYMERATDTYVFEPVRNVIGFLLTFFATTIVGLIFFDMWGYGSYMIGFIIGFIISQMITRKTFRIVNKKVLKNLIAYALIMAIIISCAATDVFGLSKRIPREEDIKRVEVVIWESGQGYTYMLESEEDEAVEKTLEMHRSIVNNRASYETKTRGRYSRFQDNEIMLTYVLNSGDEVHRFYGIEKEKISKDPAYDAFVKYAEQHSEVIK